MTQTITQNNDSDCYSDFMTQTLLRLLFSILCRFMCQNETGGAKEFKLLASENLTTGGARELKIQYISH